MNKLILCCISVLILALFIGFNFIYKSHLLAYIPYEHVLGARTISTDSTYALMYGVGVDMSQLLSTSPKYVVNSKGEDLIDIAARLGINMFRITNAKPSYEDKEPIYTKAEWNIVLNKMQNKGIKAIILVESSRIYQKYIPPAYLPFVQSYLIDSGVLSHPAVYGVDLYNEVVVNSDDNLSKLKTAAQMIKSNYPKTRITLGWWAVDTFKKDQAGDPIYKWDDYSVGKKLNNFIDFYSIHMYGFDKPFLGFYPDPYIYAKGFIADVKNGLQTKKPILIEEFGAANGDAVSDQDTIGSAELQANTYAGAYQAIIDAKDPQLLGTTAYQYNSREKGPDAWAILKDNGDYLFPAAYVLQAYATHKNVLPFVFPFTKILNSYLLTNADNESTKTIHVTDIVGFKLLLDPSQEYTLTMSGNNVLTTTQHLTNYWGQNKYYAAFHANAVGNTIVSVNQGDQHVFQVSIAVQ